MSNISRAARLWLTAGFLLCASVVLHAVSHGEPVIPRQPLTNLPYTIANWTGQERPFNDEVVQAVGVSDYTNRIYSEAGDAPVSLYIGYYASQRTGDTIHSPKNCLPGSGWDPVESGYATIPVPDGRDIKVNSYVIQKDQDKQLVFYWYQSRGRTIASEYAGKFWMIADAVSRNRTDGSLVRVITPINDGEPNARARLGRFTQAAFPKIDELLPK